MWKHLNCSRAHTSERRKVLRARVVVASPLTAKSELLLRGARSRELVRRQLIRKACGRRVGPATRHFNCCGFSGSLLGEISFLVLQKTRKRCHLVRRNSLLPIGFPFNVSRTSCAVSWFRKSMNPYPATMPLCLSRMSLTSSSCPAHKRATIFSQQAEKRMSIKFGLERSACGG